MSGWSAWQTRTTAGPTHRPHRRIGRRPTSGHHPGDCSPRPRPPSSRKRPAFFNKASELIARLRHQRGAHLGQHVTPGPGAPRTSCAWSSTRLRRPEVGAGGSGRRRARLSRHPVRLGLGPRRRSGRRDRVPHRPALDRDAGDQPAGAAHGRHAGPMPRGLTSAQSAGWRRSFIIGFSKRSAIGPGRPRGGGPRRRRLRRRRPSGRPQRPLGVAGARRAIEEVRDEFRKRFPHTQTTGPRPVDPEPGTTLGGRPDGTGDHP